MTEQRSLPGGESSQEATEAFGGADHHDTGADAGVFFRNAYAVLVQLVPVDARHLVAQEDVR